MSILHYPENGTTNNNNSTQNLQVWNNAAFDEKQEQEEEELLSSFSMKTKKKKEKKTCSWSSDCSKENLNPQSPDSSPPPVERKIDDEIEEIEIEIKRLSSRLEALRLQKANANAKKGRIVAAKFMEPKQQGFDAVSAEASAKKNKIEETPKAKDLMRRRGLSLGPAEIASRSRKVDLVVTPVPAARSRRKSCFSKLPEVDERRKSLSVGAGRVKNSIQGQRQAATTNLGGSSKFVKKEDGVLDLVQPRKLFKEGEKSVPNKKLVKPGRVVASRYNQIGDRSSGNSVAIKRSGQQQQQPSASKFPLCVGSRDKSESLCASSIAGKRLLPENDKDDNCGRCDKRRASSVASSVRMKKRWEIPAEVVVYKSAEEEEKKPLSMSSSSADSDRDIPDMSDVLLPKIRTVRYATESPRDSGAAKRVAELMTGKRSYFCSDKDSEESVCQVLDLEDEGANDEE